MRPTILGSALAPLALFLVVAWTSTASAQPAGNGVLASSACLNQTSAPSIIHQPHLTRGRSGTAIRTVVRVGLGRNGIIDSVEVIKPSGDPHFDTAALAAARSSAFAPAARGCTAVRSVFDEAFIASGRGVVVASVQVRAPRKTVMR